MDHYNNYNLMRLLTESEQSFLKGFEWYWQGRRGGVKIMQIDVHKKRQYFKDCDDRYNAKRRDIMNTVSRGEVPVEYKASEELPEERKYTLNDYTRPYIPPDIRLEIMESNLPLGKELFNAIDPMGDGLVEVGDRVEIRTSGHIFDRKCGRLTEKRKRQFYDQYECRVELDNGRMVILREDELTRVTVQLLQEEGNT